MVFDFFIVLVSELNLIVIHFKIVLFLLFSFSNLTDDSGHDHTFYLILLLAFIF